MVRTTTSYFENYIDTLYSALKSVDLLEFEKAVHFLTEAYKNNNNVFVCGNGGSWAISDHFSCDHTKGVCTDTKFLPKVQNLGASPSVMTAIANDLGYEHVFSYNLQMKASLNDVLVVVSSSGNSPNIINAINTAKKFNMTVIAMTGFNGGDANKIADIRLHVKSDNYGIVEDTHQAIMHALSQKIRIANINIDIRKQKL